MRALSAVKRCGALLVLAALLLTGCGIAASYRPADKKTIRDFSGDAYHMRVGVMALVNTTRYTGTQMAAPFMQRFLERMHEEIPDALMVLPGETGAPTFLWQPPRLANGELDVFSLSALARRDGFNVLVRPALMDARVRKEDTGFWIFKGVNYYLQIQTAASVYDAVTGARLLLKMRSDEVEIDEQQAGMFEAGQEVPVDDLTGIVEEAGEVLGEQMGDAVAQGRWLATVIAVNDDGCVIPAGSESGLDVGDKLAILDGSAMLTGIDGEHYRVPGPKIGEVVVRQVSPRSALVSPESGPLPPVGSLVIPGS